ncbi:MAG: hypothetical protein QW304_08995 [Thermoproteota archaeon]
MILVTSWLVNIMYAQSDWYYIQVGAYGYTDSYNNAGFRSNIQTIIPQAMPEGGWHYFWIGSNLCNDYFIQVGYVVCPSRPNGAWFWWAFDDAGNTVAYRFGADGSAGGSGSYFYYVAVMEGSPSYWGFFRVQLI